MSPEQLGSILPNRPHPWKQSPWEVAALMPVRCLGCPHFRTPGGDRFRTTREGNRLQTGLQYSSMAWERQSSFLWAPVSPWHASRSPRRPAPFSPSEPTSLTRPLQAPVHPQLCPCPRGPTAAAPHTLSQCATPAVGSVLKATGRLRPSPHPPFHPSQDWVAFPLCPCPTPHNTLTNAPTSTSGTVA